MNIWIFNHYAISPDMPGGTRHYDLSKELSNRGYNVTIFPSSFHYSLHKEMKFLTDEWWKAENIGGVNFVWIKTFPHEKNNWRRIINMISYMLRSYRIGRQLPELHMGISPPDVVIGSSPHLLAALSAYFLARRFKVKFIMEVRDLWPQTLIDMEIFGAKHPFVQVSALLEKYLYRRAFHIIVLPPKASDYITKLGINPQKIFWIPNGVDLLRFAHVEGSREDNVFKVIYSGAHGPSNGLDILLKAAKIIQDRGYGDITFSLIGSGSEKPKLVKIKEEMFLNNVEFCNPIPKEEIPKMLIEGDALLHIEFEFSCSKYGGSPNKLFDYMAAGKPIIYASNFVKDMLDSIGCGLYVPPGDAQALADAIVRLYKTSPEERNEIGKKGKEYIMHHHNISVLTERLENCINVKERKDAKQ